MSVSTVGLPRESRTCREFTLKIVEDVSNSGSSEIATEISREDRLLLLGKFLLRILCSRRFQ